MVEASLKALWVYIKTADIIPLNGVGKWLTAYVISMSIQT